MADYDHVVSVVGNLYTKTDIPPNCMSKFLDNITEWQFCSVLVRLSSVTIEQYTAKELDLVSKSGHRMNEKCRPNQSQDDFKTLWCSNIWVWFLFRSCDVYVLLVLKFYLFVWKYFPNLKFPNCRGEIQRMRRIWKLRLLSQGKVPSIHWSISFHSEHQRTTGGAHWEKGKPYTDWLQATLRTVWKIAPDSYITPILILGWRSIVATAASNGKDIHRFKPTQISPSSKMAMV